MFTLIVFVKKLKCWNNDFPCTRFSYKTRFHEADEWVLVKTIEKIIRKMLRKLEVTNLKTETLLWR